MNWTLFQSRFKKNKDQEKKWRDNLGQDFSDMTVGSELEKLGEFIEANLKNVLMPESKDGFKTLKDKLKV